MEFTNPGAEIFVPDGAAANDAVARTTHMGISAHQDDIEIMAYHGILECFGSEEKWFAGVVVTDGAGSPRDDLYADYSDERMRQVRKVEQKKAAVVGEYGSQLLLDYPSSAVKDGGSGVVVEELARIIDAARPGAIYTHNLTDKHDTHVATALRVIHAVRELPEEARPKAIYGCEVWRDLDWMIDGDKTPFDVSAHENLAAALVGVFDSQICGGKRYDLATMGRRKAHATYFASHGTDTTTGLSFAMDMTPLANDPTLDITEYALAYVRRFHNEVLERITRHR